MAPPDPRPLLAALGRRDFLRAAAAVTVAGGLAGCGTSAAPGSVAAALPDGPLQPGAGDIPATTTSGPTRPTCAGATSRRSGPRRC